MVHELKTLPKYFEQVRSGTKTFELRKNDRDFRAGDYLALNEWDNGYTGRTELVRISSILDPGLLMECKPGWLVLSVTKKTTLDSETRRGC